MKRFALVLVLFACGGKKDDAPKEMPPAPAPSSICIARASSSSASRSAPLGLAARNRMVCFLISDVGGQLAA
jgi:hypothetical protein